MAVSEQALDREMRFAGAGERLGRLAERARALDAAARRLAADELLLAERQRELDREGESADARATELAELEVQLVTEHRRLEALEQSLLERAVRVEAEELAVAEAAGELAQREARFARRWRWLIRSWRSRRWRAARRHPLLRSCDVLLVPTTEGYRLFAQKGMALEVGAVLSGIVDDSRVFVVSKIAPLPFGDGCCAYLQDASERGCT